MSQYQTTSTRLRVGISVLLFAYALSTAALRGDEPYSVSSFWYRKENGGRVVVLQATRRDVVYFLYVKDYEDGDMLRFEHSKTEGLIFEAMGATIKLQGADGYFFQQRGD